MSESGLASLSDSLLIVALLAYVVAMVGHAAEYAFGKRGRVASAAAVPVRELVGVGPQRMEGVSDRVAELPDASVEQPNVVEGGKAATCGRLAIGTTVLGLLAQVGCLATRGFATDRVPWGNMYEFVSLLCVAGVTAWLILVANRPVRHLGLFVLFPVVTLLGLAGTVLYAEAAPLAPALNSYWLKIHVSAAAISSGVFMVGFVTAVLFLVRHRYDAKVAAWAAEDAEKAAASDASDMAEADEDVESDRVLRFPLSYGPRLPSADVLERVTFRIHALAFPLWTFAIIAGAIWAEAAWTRYWGWDPKETWAFISWVIYAAYLHARATAGWRGTKAVFIVILGWASMMVNLFAVNLIYTGLHSYAGIS